MMIGLQYNLKTTAAYIKRNDEDVKKIFLKVKQGRPQKAQSPRKDSAPSPHDALYLSPLEKVTPSPFLTTLSSQFYSSY